MSTTTPICGEKRTASQAEIVSPSPSDGEEWAKRMRNNDVLQELRDKAKEHLSMSSVNDDLDFMVKSVRALIVTNQEIWDRCQKEAISKQVTRGSPLVMAKYCYDEVLATKLKGHPTVHITTQLNFVTNDFGQPPSIPSVLTDIMPAPDGKSFFPDYDSYVNKAGLLEEGVLILFLNKLQKHLEEIQVYLGKIDEWLSQSSVEFLSGLFRTDLMAGSGAAKARYTPKKPSSDLCTKCLCGVSMHSYTSIRTREGTRNRYRCSDGKFATFFSPPLPVTLFKKSKGSSNDFNFTFEIGTEGGKKKLQSFMSFLKN